MREILFKGKRADGKGWVEGDLTGENTIHVQPPFTDGEGGYEWWGYEVVPETVGQFTGLVDKNGKKIFEGDILSDGKGEDGAVFYTSPQFTCTTKKGEIFMLAEGKVNVDKLNYTEIIGNIHDK